MANPFTALEHAAEKVASIPGDIKSYVDSQLAKAALDIRILALQDAKALGVAAIDAKVKELQAERAALG